MRADRSGAQQGVAEAEIRKRIREQGRIPFSEFMELALYHPAGGYYSTRQAVGAQGDYYTSPAAHPAFGALLAIQMERCWELIDRPTPFYVVEIGSGDGLLAQDLLAFAELLEPDFAGALEYVALDRRPPFGYASPLGPSPQHVISDTVPLIGIYGCILSNELVDAFPVHRFKIVEGNVREVYVTLDQSGRLADDTGQPSTPEIAERLATLDHQLPEGYSSEMNLDLAGWARQLSATLERGFVITIDYGYAASELYAPSRSQGTLQTYFRHTEGTNPYERVGQQDITTHVDFTALSLEGVMAGLHTLGVVTQSDYLRGLGADQIIDAIRRMPMSAYDRDANLMGLRNVVDPRRLGRFRVLVQQKGTGNLGYDDLAPSRSRLDDLAPPLLDRRHTPLFEGRYPQQSFDLESLWPFGDGVNEEDQPG